MYCLHASIFGTTGHPVASFVYKSLIIPQLSEVIISFASAFGVLESFCGCLSTQRVLGAGFASFIKCSLSILDRPKFLIASLMLAGVELSSSAIMLKITYLES